MYWFVIYAARSQTRARSEAPHVGPPQSGSWLECPYPAPTGEEPASPVRRYTALLGDPQWTRLCEELGLDLEKACREEGHCGVCEAGPLPARHVVEEHPPQLRGSSFVVLDSQECVVGPVAAIALELPGTPCSQGAATGLQAALCVAPMHETDAEREQVRSLFAMVAFNVGGGEAELRCPDCASPELSWLGGPDLEEQMGCGNCGMRLSRQAALLRLGDCEAFLAAASSPVFAAAAAVGGDAVNVCRPAGRAGVPAPGRFEGLRASDCAVATRRPSR